MKPFLFSLFVFISVTPFVLADPAGWSNDVQITTNGPHNQASLAIDKENNLHMVWVACDSNCNSPTPNTEIYYKSFDGNGMTITPDMRLTFNVAKSEKPSIIVDTESNAHVIWEEYRNGNEEIYYLKLSANGSVLIPETRLIFGQGIHTTPALAIDAQDNLHIVWEGTGGSACVLCYKKFNKNGLNLTDTVSIVPQGYLSGNPSLAVDQGGNVHLVWADDRDYSYPDTELYYEKLDSNGNTLIQDTRITFNQAYKNEPSLAVDTEDRLSLVWEDKRNGLPQVYYKKLNADGMSLTADIRVSSELDADKPAVAVDKTGNSFIVWRANSFYRPAKIAYAKLSYQSNLIINDTLATQTRSYILGIVSMASDTFGNMHIVWSDNDIYYKHSLPPQFTIQGQPRIGNTVNIALSDPLNPNTPYLFLMSLSNNTGIPLGDGRKIPLDYDGLFEASLFYPQYLGLNNAQGMIDQNGNAVVTLAIPNIPALVGLNLYVGYITIYPGRPIPQLINSIADAEKIIFY